MHDDPRIDDLVRRGPWTRIDRLERVTSTQDVALAALVDGTPPGLVVVADAQTSGRGRRGRRWRDDVVNADGTPASVAVTATWRAGARDGLVPLVAGMSVVDACRGQGAPATLKWPNDVLIVGRKASGILVERHDAAGGVLLIGCGIDVDWRGVVRRGEARDWTSLAEQVDADIDRTAVLVDLLDGLARGLREPASAVLARYREVCDTLGHDVRVALPDGVRLDGRAVDVDDQGRLLVDVDGRVRAVTAGDVVHVR